MSFLPTSISSTFATIPQNKDGLTRRRWPSPNTGRSHSPRNTSAKVAHRRRPVRTMRTHSSTRSFEASPPSSASALASAFSPRPLGRACCLIKNANSFHHARLAEAERTGGTDSTIDKALDLNMFTFGRMPRTFRMGRWFPRKNSGFPVTTRSARKIELGMLIGMARKKYPLCDSFERSQKRIFGLSKNRYPLGKKTEARDQKCLFSQTNATCGAAFNTKRLQKKGL